MTLEEKINKLKVGDKIKFEGQEYNEKYIIPASFIKGKVRDIVEMSLTNDCTKSLEK